MASNDSKQQELPQWRSEEPTPAGPGPRASYPQPVSGMNNNNNNEADIEASKCSKCVRKCGPIGWYFSPILDQFGYSCKTLLFHFVMFALTLAVFIIVVTLFSVSVGLLILVFGFILYWWTCEIAVFLARIDLAISYYLVEDDIYVKKQRSHTLQLKFYKNIPPCPCSSQTRNQGVSCMSAMGSRMKALALQWEMYKIFFYQMLIKPIVTSVTCWISMVVIYFIAVIFTPVVYLIYPKVFTDHYWCEFGGSSNNGEKCYGIAIDNFGYALLMGIGGFLVTPLILHINIWFAKFSKIVTYWFLTNYYSNDMDNEKDNLLFKNNNGAASNNASGTATSGQANIVHSVNNIYDETAQV